MSIDNQIEIPQSFMAMYVAPGRSRPAAPQDTILARYEQCEDMASMLAEHAQTLAFDENLSEQEVLMRCHQGLSAEQSDFSEGESEWVIRRLAELLGWAGEELGDGERQPSLLIAARIHLYARITALFFDTHCPR